MANKKENIQSLNPRGYINNREVTNLDGKYLVKGSKNVFIVNGEKIVNRPGYTLLGAAKTVNKGITSSFDWQTNTDMIRNIRGDARGQIDCWYDDAWLKIAEGLPLLKSFEYVPWWDSTENIDVLLFVCGDNKVREWSGGITEVASVTTNTITKKGYVSGSTYSYVAATRTIADSGSGFVTAGFVAGDIIIVSGSTSNDGQYEVESVTAGAIVVTSDYTLTDEAAGDATIIKTPTGTWALSRFLTTGTRKVTIDGTEYTYTGGEDTGTLTGVTGDPVVGGVSAGDTVIQTVREHTPAALTDMNIDLVGVLYNNVFYGSFTSRVIYISSDSDFTSFTHSTPRIAGEGWQLTLDSCPTAFSPDEDDMYISAREDDWYRVMTQLSADQNAEAISIRKLKTATGQGAIGPGAVFHIKNNVAFVSFEPTIDTIGRVESIDTPQSVPLSDSIKDDVETYDFTGCHGKYYKRTLWISVPRHGIAIVYDVQNGYWQPPQDLPIGRFSIIKVNGKPRLIGHSSVSNESYLLNEGFNDNGASINCIAAMGYENFGDRFAYKQFDEVGLEMYASVNTTVNLQVNYDYQGSSGVRSFAYDASDPAISFSPNISAGFGQNPFGSQPYGSIGTPPEDMRKIRAIDTTTPLDWFERQFIFSMNSPDGRFAIISSNENTQLSPNKPISITR